MAEIKQQVEAIVTAVVKKNLEGKTYSPTTATDLSNTISTEVIAELKGKYDKYKFMLSSLVMQKGESGLSISGACLWDTTKDSNTVVMQENESLICIINIFFVHI